jgi:nitroimidazol reductase NimA-like FMN-containing flavoprotein (pyridoxamine 5'-phosphate oxidase superfamily)
MKRSDRDLSITNGISIRGDMRRSDREITDLFEIVSILNAATVCRIGIADSGEPYLIPVCFGYIHGTINIHSPLSGKKLRCWRKIPGAALRLTSVTPSFVMSARVHRGCDTKV